MKLIERDPKNPTNKCDECKQDFEAAVLIGEEPDYDANFAYICEPCLKKALDLIRGIKIVPK